MIFLFVLVYCLKGYEILLVVNEICLFCLRGFYKDNFDLFGSCVFCLIGNIIEKMNFISIESCFISKYFVKGGES